MATTDVEATSLLETYRTMSIIREVESRILELHGTEIVGSVHPALGQEAVAAGAMTALGANDLVVATYRGHHWALACGVPVRTLIAEVAGRAEGTNGGRGGSAFLSSPGHRFMGENSIVGAGLPIANGLAMAAKLKGEERVVLVAFGDGATNQGAAYEGLVFSVARHLPVVFLCENNGWSEMTPIESMVPVDLAARAAAVGLPTLVVDGLDPSAVEGAVRAAVERARAHAGPTFVECRTVRLGGHYQADIEHYRPSENQEQARKADPLVQLRHRLIDAGVSENDLSDVQVQVEALVERETAEALAGPPPDPASALLSVYAGSTGGTASALPDRGTELTYSGAVNAALRRELDDRPEVVLFGEDVALPGGVFGVTKGLVTDFGPDRVFDTPISEAAILGAAVGAAMTGIRPVVEVMFGDFLFVALDQLVNQAANVAYLHRGELACPLVVRTQHGTTPGACAQHAQQLEAVLAHVPGLRVGLPATAHDAYSMTRAAIASDDPVVLYESRALYNQRGLVDLDEPVGAPGGARLHGTPGDVVIVSWGAAVPTALAAQDLLRSGGVQAGVLDLRWLNPLDDESLEAAVQRASRVLVVHEANVSGGFGAEVVARVSERCFHHLDAPPVRLGLPDTRVPAAPLLQRDLVPTPEKIVERVHHLLSV